jgi:hypothetical protein
MYGCTGHKNIYLQHTNETSFSFTFCNATLFLSTHANLCGKVDAEQGCSQGYIQGFRGWGGNNNIEKGFTFFLNSVF